MQLDKEPEIIYEHPPGSISESQIESCLVPAGIIRFKVWMLGQACPVDPNGVQNLYWIWDFMRFLRTNNNLRRYSK